MLRIWDKLREITVETFGGIGLFVGLGILAWWLWDLVEWIWSNPGSTLTLLFLVFLCLTFLFLRPAINNYRYLRALRHHGGPFLLLLGSFQRTLDDESVSKTVEVDGKKFEVDLSQEKLEGRSSESYLDAFELPTLRLGGKLHKNDTVLFVSDHDWYKAFEYLAACAHMIVIVPGTTGSLVKELYKAFEYLAACAHMIVIVPGTTGSLVKELNLISERNDLRYKAFVFQPPALQISDQQEKNLVDAAAAPPSVAKNFRRSM